MTDLSVLIVDDDFHVGRLHAGYVDSVPGFSALAPVGTAEQALRTVHGHAPDLMLLDVYLPDALGLDLLRKVDVDTIMLTAAADAPSVRKALRRGALGYLIEPVHGRGTGAQAARLRTFPAAVGRAACGGSGHG